MKKLFVPFVLLVLFGSCQTEQDENVSPVKIKTHLREGITEEEYIMTATLVARRGDSPETIKEQIASQMTEKERDSMPDDEIEIRIKHYLQVFEKYEECQAIFRDDISKVEFGYVKELPKEQTTLRAIVCVDKECEPNGIIVEINRPKNDISNSASFRFVGGPVSEWIRAVFF